MTTTATAVGTTQVYRVYIKATPEAIWDAITKPEWTERYGYCGRVDYDLRPGGTYTGYTTAAIGRAFSLARTSVSRILAYTERGETS